MQSTHHHCCLPASMPAYPPDFHSPPSLFTFLFPLLFSLNLIQSILYEGDENLTWSLDLELSERGHISVYFALRKL